MRFWIVFALFPILVNAAGFRNPDFRDSSYRMILVTAPVADLGFRDNLEKWIASEIKDNGGTAVTYLSMFSPAKRYDAKQIEATLAESRIDAVLVVSLSSVTSDSQLFGILSNTQPLGYGNLTTVAPLVANKRRATASLTLFDVASGQSVWVGNAERTVRGFKAKSETAVFENLAEDIAEALKADRLLAK